MHPGEIALGPAEEMPHQIPIRLLASSREALDMGAWRYRLCSPFWRIYVNDRRGGYVKYGRHTLDLLPDRCYLLPAWLEFETGLRHPVIQDYIHFTWAGLSSAVLQRVFPAPVLLKRDPVVEELVQHWREKPVSAADDLAGTAFLYSLIYAAIARLLEQLSPEQRKISLGWLSQPAEVQPALELIEARLANPPVIAELAATLRLSPSHFIRVFRKHIGLTPWQYSLERRITASAQWLTESSRTIDEVAELAGFTDRFHFSKAFKARLRVSPAEYRKIHSVPGAWKKSNSWETL